MGRRFSMWSAVLVGDGLGKLKIALVSASVPRWIDRALARSPHR